MEYESVIGLEIHAELKTRTKMFCDSLNDPDEKHPNINVCPVCMGHPGTLPVANREAIHKVIRVGLALDGAIPPFSQFDRKNYFYPDLPKGYQISQYEYPLVQGGYLDIKFPISLNGRAQRAVANFQFPNKSKTENSNEQNNGTKRIRIRRIHLEEDAGRLIHLQPTIYSLQPTTLVDFNRAGIPLMELVTEPDIRSGGEARMFAEELRAILRATEASDADMERGQMRIEVNISLREVADKHGQGADGRGIPYEPALGTKVEVKNINSFRFVEQAILYETERQRKILEDGGKIIQETRGWDEKREATVSQRLKEEAHDYRYFPEPDLPPLDIGQDLVDELFRGLPELPQKKTERFQNEFLLEPAIARALAYDRQTAAYFEAASSEIAAWCEDAVEVKTGVCNPADLYRTLAHFIITHLQSLLAEKSAPIDDMRITPEDLAELVTYIATGKLSQSAAKEVLKEMFSIGEDPSVIADRRGLWQTSDTGEIENIVRKVIKANPKAVADIRGGKHQVAQFLAGQVMKESRGRANPVMVQELIKKQLSV